MNLNTITKPNSKGQIVIPKRFREELGIDESVLLNIVLRSGGVFISPFDKSVKSSDSREVSLEILKRTAGSWSGDDWEEAVRKRRLIELRASKQRKRKW